MIGTTARLALAVTIALAWPAAAAADQWNDRTVLSFSEPVMIPGTTLPAGTYVFQIADSPSARNTVQVYTEDQQKLIATTMAVPTKRMDAKSDVVVRFNPTEAGAPPALKAWFYPGSLYGHEFVYSDEQGKHIANRTKTLVLSTDAPDSDREKGTLHTFDAAGTRTPWQGDPATMKEWETWHRNRAAGATAQAKPQPKESADVKVAEGEAKAPMMRGTGEGMRVKLDDLEDNTEKYMGKTISVDAKVEEIYGPRLFTIDEPNWFDLAGEVIVYMGSDLAALVREDDRVTITGTVKPFVLAELEEEWGWLGLDKDVELKVSRKPVLVADRIVGGTNNVAMAIRSGSEAERPVGTTGTAATPITDAASIGDEKMVGRHVDLKNAQVTGVAKQHGFFVQSGQHNLFVLPTIPAQTTVQKGDAVTISGVILQMPDSMDDRLDAPGTLNDNVYVYAMRIEKK